MNLSTALLGQLLLLVGIGAGVVITLCGETVVMRAVGLLLTGAALWSACTVW